FPSGSPSCPPLSKKTGVGAYRRAAPSRQMGSAAEVAEPGERAMRGVLACGVIALAALAGALPAAAAQGAAGLSGTWRLVETRQVMADGTVRPDPDLGPRPSGYMMYDDAGGRVCTVFNDTTRPRWAAARPSETEARMMFDQMVVYCGRYRVD